MLDPADVLRELGISGVRSVDPVKGGEDALLWRVETRTKTYALRVMRPEQARVARLEAIAMRAAESAGTAVPRVHAIATYRDRPAMLLDWCAGRTMAAELADRPWRVWSLGRALGRAHARLNLVAAPPDLPNSWRARAADPDLEARLPAGDRLLHLDFHPLNVMTDGREVTAVIDWTNTSAGDPRADVARSLAILLLAPMGPNIPKAFALLRRILAAAYQSAYGRLDGMAPFHLWAAEAMLREFAPRASNPDHWMRPTDLASIRHWRNYWAQP